MKALLKRFDYTEKQTNGVLTIFNESDTVFTCYTLELPDLCNAKRISCIPSGTYKVVIRFSKKFGKHFHITDVNGRSYILIHSGNFYTQILGCVLVGDSLLDINRDGVKDVLNSRKTLKKLLKLAPNGFELEIL